MIPGHGIAAKLIVVCFVLVLAAAPAAASHDKIEIATTNDGVTYVGEIKSVEYATLSLKTNAAGLLHIEWRCVSGLTSNFQYQVEVGKRDATLFWKEKVVASPLPECYNNIIKLFSLCTLCLGGKYFSGELKDVEASIDGYFNIYL